MLSPRRPTVNAGADTFGADFLPAVYRTGADTAAFTDVLGCGTSIVQTFGECIMPRLWYRDLQDEACTLVMSGNRLRIGRSDACWLALDSDRVSRVHAELVRDKFGQWTIADHGSANGTKVNGQAVSKHVLTAGDVISIGGFDLHFIDESAPVEARLVDAFVPGFASVSDAEDIADQGSALDIINTLLDEAAERRCSDVHIEPIRTGIRVRIRIDGVLEEVRTLPASAAASLVSRVKVMSNLNIAEKRSPQDGRFRYYAGDNAIDVRVAIIPTILGERITLRLLGVDRSLQGLKVLGMSEPSRKLLTKLIKKPHGIILITGPTGSGKTTTLYSAISLINDVTKHIVTIENPVEYNIEGVAQVQVNPDAKITFASALRSILRHDPDVIMVGEIRDHETAHLALEASLTGHLVFATLHTNSASGALTRLLDMGAEPYLVASGVMACVAQRLVRCVCPHCKETYRASPEEMAYCQLGKTDKAVDLARGRGCSTCRGRGFLNRTGLFEIVPISEAMGQLIMRTAPTEQMQRLAVEEGMVTLRRDGITKALAGATTLAEVIRVTMD